MTTDTVNIESLWKVFDEAVGKRDLKAASAAQSEIKKFENKERDARVEAEKASRDLALDRITKGLKGFTLAPIRDAVQINGRVTRGEDGKFDNLIISVGVGDLKLADAFYQVFPESEIANLETVNGVNFTIKKGEVEVEYTGRRASTESKGGNGGKGWVKEGSPLTKLGDIFDAYATDAEKATAATYRAANDGSGDYRTKTSVAKREGFTQNS